MMRTRHLLAGGGANPSHGYNPLGRNGLDVEAPYARAGAQ